MLKLALNCSCWCLVFRGNSYNNSDNRIEIEAVLLTSSANFVTYKFTKFDGFKNKLTMKILNCRVFACCRDVSILTRGRGTKLGAVLNQCITLSQMAHMLNNTQINQIVNNLSTDLKLLSSLDKNEKVHNYKVITCNNL